MRDLFSLSFWSVALLLLAVAVARPALALQPPLALVQESIPAPPQDRTLIYWRSEKDGALAPLSMEAGASPLRMETLATSDKLSRLELKGEHSATRIGTIEPHFFLFVPEGAAPHPPLLVRLEEKRGARRVAVMAQRGQRGFAIASSEIVKPHYRVLSREGGMIYMEVWGREPLQSGEYAFIGSDMTRIATFSLEGARSL